MDLASPAFELTRLRLVDRFGSEVAEWWRSLPGVVERLAGDWGLLVVQSPVGRGNTSLVLRCRRADGDAAILKLCPDPGVVASEALALQAWQSSRRVPGLWESDAGLGALLLEAIPAEAPVAGLPAEVDLQDVGDLMTALHDADVGAAGRVEPLVERVQFIAELWTRRHRASAAARSVVSAELLRRGCSVACELARREGGVLLHGDLHPGNVLSAGPVRGLVAIDPRPCRGDDAFDGVDWVFWRTSDARAWRARARELSATAGWDDERLWRWCSALAAVFATAETIRHGRTNRTQALLDIAA